MAGNTSHDHASLFGGDRASQAERYPPRLVTAVLKALRLELVSRGELGALEAGPTVEEEELITSAVRRDDHRQVLDRITGEVLDAKLVVAAREEEMDYMKTVKVFERVSVDVAWEETGAPPINVDWVDVNKGDGTRPNVRSRLVAQETRRVSTIDAEDISAVFAATPPLEALRFLLSMAMTERKEDRLSERVVMFLDISRAHLHSPIRRAVFVKACAEDIECPEGFCWRLLKAMYGLRDAGACFDKKVEDVMKQIGFTQGAFSPCIYHHVKTGAVVFRHGDDFVCLGGRALLAVPETARRAHDCQEPGCSGTSERGRRHRRVDHLEQDRTLGPRARRQLRKHRVRSRPSTRRGPRAAARTQREKQGGDNSGCEAYNG